MTIINILTISASHPFVSMEPHQQQPKQPKKTVLCYVCPDRLRGGSIKRKADAAKYEPKTKKHCSGCLNTNLICVDEIRSAVETLLSSSCEQCGVLWADIKQDREAHADMHLKKTLMSVGIDMNAKTKANKHYTRDLREKAFSLYYADKLASESMAVNKFSRMSEKEQKKYLAAAKSFADDDMGMLAGTVYEGNLTDDRPPVNLSYLPFFCSPKDSIMTYHFKDITETYGKYSYIANCLKDETTPHITYQVDIPITTPNWGSDQVDSQYVCYICTDPLCIDYTGENGPAVLNAKVCACSAHDDQAYEEQEEPPQYVPPQPEAVIKVATVVNVPLPKATPPQTAVGYKNNIKFLYHCNSAFAGYVIHSQCCKVPYNPTKLVE